MAWKGPILLKIGSLGAQIWGRRPPIEGLGGPDPRSGASNLAILAKFGVPKTDFPIGGANFGLPKEAKTPLIWPILANFRDPSLEKVAEFWPRMGIGSPFLDPEGSANPEGP